MEKSEWKCETNCININKVQEKVQFIFHSQFHLTNLKLFFVFFLTQIRSLLNFVKLSGRFFSRPRRCVLFLAIISIIFRCIISLESIGWTGRSWVIVNLDHATISCIILIRLCQLLRHASIIDETIIHLKQISSASGSFINDNAAVTLKLDTAENSAHEACRALGDISGKNLLRKCEETQ